MPNQQLISYVSEIENYIQQYGVSLEAVEKLRDASDVAINSEKDIEYGLQISAKAKSYCEQLVKNTSGMSMFEVDELCKKQGATIRELEVWWQILKLEAPHLLDSYLLYLEKKRDYKDKFYLPRRKCLLKIGLVQALQDIEDDKLDILSISLIPGGGKAQPMYSKVLTPSGFVEMGSLQVGSKVVSASGKVANVLGIYPQGKKPIYELTLDDGSKCRCSDEHLWTVQSRADRQYESRTGFHRTSTLRLKDMLDTLCVGGDGRANYSIDYVPPIEFEEKKFVIHPYVMGILLGDGGFTDGTPNISTVDDDVIEKVNSLLPRGYYLKHKDRCTYSVHGHEGNNCKAGSLITLELKKYGLFKKKSIGKSIPKDYLYASYEQRLALLRGLMDSDGYATPRYGNYSTISEHLANDVCELVHSLGGYASKTRRKAGYKKNGVYKQCNDYYELIIQFDSSKEEIFTIKRKGNIYKPKRSVIKRFVKSIEYVGEEECQCIYIDDESHLYITDDYIITHNTTIEKFFTTFVIGRHLDDFNLFFSHSGDITRMYYDGILDITTNTDEYTWNEIFPKAILQSTNAKAEQLNFGKYKPFPSIQCTSVGSKNAGKVRANRYLLCDDMIGGIEEALNKNILDKLWNIYAVDAKQRKLDGCKEIHIATRWSVHDIIGRLQEIYRDNPRARFIAVPDIDPVTGESNFSYDINGFSVEFFNEQQLIMDDVSYRCLYKNEPIEREGLLYHDEELRKYCSLPDREPDAIIGVCDTKTTGVDYMVLPVFYQYGNDFYLVDCICDNSSDFGVQQERLSNIIVNHKMQQCEFESNAGGSRLAHEINKLVETKGGRCNITTKATETNKETRIIVNSDWIKKHCLFKERGDYAPKSDYATFMNFMLSYSVAGKNKHDDVVDCLANFALYVTKKNRVRTTVIMQSPF